LRGQLADNRAWLEDPSSPAIIVGTVDMIGSRLLFQGYGVSPRMRPVYAALLGVDALAVLDEAHLVPPFENLLEAVDRNTDSFGQHSDLCNIIPRSKVLSLSATGRARHSNIFRLSEPDLQYEVVKSRLEAKKAIGLIELGNRKLEEALAEEAW